MNVQVEACLIVPAGAVRLSTKLPFKYVFTLAPS